VSEVIPKSSSAVTYTADILNDPDATKSTNAMPQLLQNTME